MAISVSLARFQSYDGAMSSTKFKNRTGHLLYKTTKIEFFTSQHRLSSCQNKQYTLFKNFIRIPRPEGCNRFGETLN